MTKNTVAKNFESPPPMTFNINKTNPTKRKTKVNWNISIPAGHDSNGYPLGLQIIGKAFDEQNILNIAYAMEEKINFKNKITDWWIK